VESGTTKQRILDRSYQLAGLYGLEALTIGGLAGDLGMSKAGIHGHFGSKQELQLSTIRRAREIFQRDIIRPAETAPAGLPRLWAMATVLTAYSTETGLHGGDFWVMVANEYDARTGPVRDAVETTMSWWMRQIEAVITTAVELGQLTPCDPAQLAFEVQALFDAGGHQYRLYHDPKASARARVAIRQRLEHFRGPRFPALPDLAAGETPVACPQTRMVSPASQRSCKLSWRRRAGDRARR
jgi:AcrR family transcriptional regulator